MPFTSGFKKAPISLLEYSIYVLSRRRPCQNVIQISDMCTYMTYVPIRTCMYPFQWLLSKGKCRTLPGQRSSSNFPSNARLLTASLPKCLLFPRCAELSMRHGKVSMSVQDFPGLCLNHTRSVQIIATVNIAASVSIEPTEIWKISPCGTFLLWKKYYGRNTWKHWAWYSCFWGCFSPPSSVDIAATCYRWWSASFWRNGLLQARCSI